MCVSWTALIKAVIASWLYPNANVVFKLVVTANLCRHTGVVVYGKEYFFGGMGIEFCNPVRYCCGHNKETRAFHYTEVLLVKLHSK